MERHLQHVRSEYTSDRRNSKKSSSRYHSFSWTRPRSAALAQRAFVERTEETDRVTSLCGGQLHEQRKYRDESAAIADWLTCTKLSRESKRFGALFIGELQKHRRSSRFYSGLNKRSFFELCCSTNAASAGPHDTIGEPSDETGSAIVVRTV